jgi:c-di-GMP-binding flagellar brake protein YcgR
MKDQVRITLVQDRQSAAAEQPTFQCAGTVSRFEGDTLMVAVPTSGQETPLCAGQAVLIRRVLHESWRHEAMITRCLEQANSIVIAMQLVRSEKVERREFVRIRLEAKVRYARMEEDSTDRVWRPAVMCDISGGGARVVTSEALPMDDNVLLEIPVEQRLLHLKGRVQRSQPEPGRAGKFDIGIAFVEIHPSECNLVMSLVFRLQLKFQRQKAIAAR